jgi:16S rRNA processing protein RimM
LPVGRIGRPHGIRGEVTVVVDGDPDRFVPGAIFGTDRPGMPVLTLAAARRHRDRGMIVSFEGVADRTAAEDLRGIVLTIAGGERRDLETDEFWPDDLVGLRAVDASGEPLGEVTGVVFGPQDRLVVATPDGRSVEVPFVHDIVGDPEGGCLRIDPPAGLFEDDG